MSKPPADRPPSWVYRWDLDKTYLRTEFDTVRALLRTAFEGAEEKQTIPGAATLLRALRGDKGKEVEPSRICFISGSPRQMRKVLVEKLRLDGVAFDEFILKPNLQNMLTGRFRAMREQVGYKLPALLSGRAGVPAETREICFGDDAEADGFIYSLYGDVLSGVVGRDELQQILDEAGVYPEDADRTLSLSESLARAEAVVRIFILLDRRSPPRRFDKYGPRLVPIYNYFQAALVLHAHGRVDAAAVLRVALEMVDKHAYSLDALRNSLQDLLRRGRLDLAAVQALGEAVVKEADGTLSPDAVPALGALPGARELVRAFAARLRDLGAAAALVVDAPAQGRVDYLKAMEEDLPKRKPRRRK